MFAPKPHAPLLAALLIAVATAFIALATLFAKALGQPIAGEALHPLQVTWGRYLFAMLGVSVAVAVLRPRFTKIHLHRHVARTLCGFGGVTLMFAAVNTIPLADATAISFLNPVFAMIFAVIFLGERVGRWRWFAAGLAICGTVILLRPTPQGFEPAALLALGAALALGLELIVMKRLTRAEGPLQILFVNNILGCALASAAVIPVWQSPSLGQWGLLAGLGLSMATAQACYINGMARADASFVAPLSYGTLVFAALFDALFFGVIPSLVTWIGAGIIMTGAFLLAWRESRAARLAV